MNGKNKRTRSVCKHCHIALLAFWINVWFILGLVTIEIFLIVNFLKIND